MSINITAKKIKKKPHTELTITGWFVYGWLMGFVTLGVTILLFVIFIFIV